MQSLQPRSLTNKELKNYADLIGAEKLPASWVIEILRRTEKNWLEEKHTDPRQLELDFS